MLLALVFPGPLPELSVNLAIFDVDGTLTATSDVDSECFVQAIGEVLGIRQLDTDWSHYQICSERFGAAPDDATLCGVRDQFIELLRDRMLIAPERYEEVPGAASALYRLRNERDWAIAIASGAWPGSARIKLQSAGISPAGFASVFADESITREGIIQLAISRALARYQQARFERIVSIGDAVWDVRAARSLGLPFVGIGDGSGRNRLFDEGASHVISNFVDFDRLLKCLDEATVPNQSLSLDFSDQRS
jgi:phosphoglycolate phosphatase-like HAD superfamily hydrolase